MGKDNPADLLNQLSEQVENTGFSDEKGWNGIASAIDNLIESQKEDVPGAAKLLRFCKKTAAAFAKQTVSDRFPLIEALTTALLAAGSGDETKIRLAGQEIGRLLNPVQGGSPASEQRMPSETPAAVKMLTEAASRLMRADPAQKDEIRRIHSFIIDYLTELDDTDDKRPHIISAVEGVSEVLEGAAPDPSASLAGAAMALDDALEAADNPPKDAARRDMPQSESGEKAPTTDKPEPDALPPEHDYRPEDMDPELLGEFISESIDLISDAESALLDLESDPDDTDAIGKVLRAFHTVKGTSAFLDLGLLSDIGHHAENLLIRVREGEIRYGGGYADLALRSLDLIKGLVYSVKDAMDGNPLLKPDGFDELKVLLSDPEAAGISGEEGDETPPRVGDILVAQGDTDREAVEAAMIKAPPGEPVGKTLVKANVASVTKVGQALRVQEKIKSPRRDISATVKVSILRLDRLIDMVGELVIAHSMVAQDDIVMEAGNHALQKKVNHTSKIVRELQDLTMSMRMVPLKATFQKMARLIRDVSRRVSKQVLLVTEGEDTEIDRNLVDIINDPLVHMIRNSVDHGVESPKERTAVGKTEAGTVKLSAYHSAGRVVVEVADDGKGLNKEAILAKAKERGLINDENTVTDREVYNLVFEPGFSTAAEVTEVSGRGVGMDVVRRNIESLRGQVEINSEPGKGCVFKMSLPLTLAIIDGMVVKGGGETYVLPTICIVRIVNPKPGEMHSVLKRGEMLLQQDQLIPIIHFEDAYDVTRDNNKSGQKLIMVIEDDGRQAGLIIDELVGRQQVVVKSLGKSLSEVPGITGGAILPNGRVGLIIDIGGLMRAAYTDNRYESAPGMQIGAMKG